MDVHRLRCLGVALALTTTGSGVVVGLGRGVGGPVHGAEDAVVRLCLALLLGATAWAWLVGLAAVRDAWSAGPVPTTPRTLRPGGGVRRIVLAACGVAVTGALLAPAAHAADGHRGRDPLDGLPMPQRAVGAAIAHHDVVVRPGDTLWSLAARRLPPGTPAAAVDVGWRRLYAANRAVVGADPDRIRPGQVLHAPTHQSPSKEPR